jgi:hypothetical protein
MYFAHLKPQPMKTKVRILSTGRRYFKGQEGYIDGYVVPKEDLVVTDPYYQVFALVVINQKIVLVPVSEIQVI